MKISGLMTLIIEHDILFSTAIKRRFLSFYFPEIAIYFIRHQIQSLWY